MSYDDQVYISRWAEKTFGLSTPARAATRMNEEVAELLKFCSMDQTPEIRAKIHEECADVLIVLYVLSSRLGIDLHEEVRKKMEINVARKWKLDGSGCGQHVEDIEDIKGQDRQAGPQ